MKAVRTQEVQATAPVTASPPGIVPASLLPVDSLSGWKAMCGLQANTLAVFPCLRQLSYQFSWPNVDMTQGVPSLGACVCGLSGQVLTAVLMPRASLTPPAGCASAGLSCIWAWGLFFRLCWASCWQYRGNYSCSGRSSVWGSRDQCVLLISYASYLFIPRTLPSVLVYDY